MAQRDDQSPQGNLVDEQLKSATVRQHEQHFHEWMQSTTRFFVLANAGGAVATLSFLGTSMAEGATFWPAVVSLGCFFAGIVIAGLVIMAQLTAAYRTILHHEVNAVAAEASIQRSWVTRLADQIEPRAGRFLAAAFGCFVAGGIVGIVALAMF